MVVGKHAKSLIGAVLADEPSWRFWDPVDEDELDDGWENLEESEDLP